MNLHSSIYRDWGLHYKRQQDYSKALKSFEDSIESNSTKLKSLLERSVCRSKLGQPNEALRDAKECLNLHPNSIAAKHTHANCLYELNRLEDTLKISYNTFYEHPKDHLGKTFIDTVHLNVEHAIGPQAGPILRKINYKLQKNSNLLSEKMNDDVPIWKVLKEKQECDVISLHEEENETPLPNLQWRKTQNEHLKHEIYYDATVGDQIKFWMWLKHHEAINLPQTPNSSKILMKTIDHSLNRLESYEQMLYTREPLYSKRSISTTASNSKSRLVAFYYLQQNTRREAFSQLDKIKELAKIDFDQMLNAVEKIMYEFYAIKTYAIFPRKFEFINEIYNFIGIEYINRMQTIPCEMMNADIEERIMILFKTPPMKKANVKISNSLNYSKFGDRSAFHDPEAVDQNQIRLQNKTKHFHMRLSHSQYPIEKAYLNYQLSELYLNGSRLEESQQYARDLVAEAHLCKNNIWKFLGYLNIARCDAMKRNFLRVTRNLKELTKIAKVLGKFAEVFVRTAIRTNEDIEALRNINSRKSRMTRDSIRSSQTESRQSILSRNVSNLNDIS